ncbi:MAG: thioredoxin fold domain-containing protein [Deltaproteobacteria bacterium]|nr:thioredoxin fold domain-containing protein [Deltaproteobacteria bacterium]MBW2016961.1 thioredoxin fold domain-containing protein [Deltaproteobacteria bacterium]MBW2130744.1 thioredoxin fold domain-containing protein [Deltaproteobacteria bacterium]MBW2302428.1 thioredoxin fold domain-containing protein [Deltaproteobacteria bacterium]
MVAKGIVLMDFNAPWCTPCRLQEPIIRHLAVRFRGKVRIEGMNVDEHPDLALDMGIRSIPTLILFKDGKEMKRFVGLQSETTLAEALDNLLESVPEGRG